MASMLAKLLDSTALRLRAYSWPLAVNVTWYENRHLNTPSAAVSGQGPSVHVASETEIAMGVVGVSADVSEPHPAAAMAPTTTTPTKSAPMRTGRA